jgi:hypothetical protein
MLRERLRAWWNSRSSVPSGAAEPAAGDPVAPVDLEGVRTLGEAARLFFSRPGPQFLVANALASWAARATLGPPSRGELGVAAAVVAWWPVQEWAAHRWLLHWEPRAASGQRIDPLFARKHRAHHRAPRELGHTLLPMEVLRAAAPANVAFWLLASRGSVRRAATRIATYSTMALVYEWTHFLVHTDVSPRTAFAKRVRRNHLLHHYRNEAYWLSFTWPDVDRWLGTEPEPASVPRSPTAQRLHGLDE